MSNSSSIGLKRDHQTSSIDESHTTTKKVKQDNIINRCANNSTKKLVIKNLKSSSLAPPPDYFDKIWPLLKQALDAILNGTTSPINEEQLYRHIDHLCTTSINETNSSNLLYENLRQVLDTHVQTFLPKLLNETNDSNDYLRTLNTIWNDHIIRSVNIDFLIFLPNKLRFCRLSFDNYLLFLTELMFFMQLYPVYGLMIMFN